MTPAQARFVCAIARIRPTEAQLQEAVALAPPSEAWPTLVDELMSHGVAPLVWRNLPDELRRRIPASQRERLERIRLTTLAFYLRAERALLHALDVLQPLGIQPIVLKGMALAERLYGRPDLRPMCDVDLYVPHKESRRAQEALLAAGWRRAPETRLDAEHHHRAFLREGAMLELHHALAPAARYPIPYAAFEARSVEIDFSRTRARILCAEDMLLHLCIHLATHHFETRLKWLVDIHELIMQGQPDWAALVARAQEVDATTACFVALKAAETQLGTTLPRDTMAELKPTGLRGAVLPFLVDFHSDVVARPARPSRLYQIALMLTLSRRISWLLLYAFRQALMRLLNALWPQRQRA